MGAILGGPAGVEDGSHVGLRGRPADDQVAVEGAAAVVGQGHLDGAGGAGGRDGV